MWSAFAILVASSDVVRAGCYLVLKCMWYPVDVVTLLSMRSEVVAFMISNSLGALILLGSFSKCKIVKVYSIGRISCPVFSICSENVDFPFDVAKSVLCSLNLVWNFFMSSLRKTCCSYCVLVCTLVYFRIYCGFRCYCLLVNSNILF